METGNLLGVLALIAASGLLVLAVGRTILNRWGR